MYCVWLLLLAADACCCLIACTAHLIAYSECLIKKRFGLVITRPALGATGTVQGACGDAHSPPLHCTLLGWLPRGVQVKPLPLKRRWPDGVPRRPCARAPLCGRPAPSIVGKDLTAQGPLQPRVAISVLCPWYFRTLTFIGIPTVVRPRRPLVLRVGRASPTRP